MAFSESRVLCVFKVDHGSDAPQKLRRRRVRLWTLRKVTYRLFKILICFLGILLGWYRFESIWTFQSSRPLFVCRSHGHLVLRFSPLALRGVSCGIGLYGWCPTFQRLRREHSVDRGWLRLVFDTTSLKFINSSLWGCLWLNDVAISAHWGTLFDCLS